jgi:hypothetical protein
LSQDGNSLIVFVRNRTNRLHMPSGLDQALEAGGGRFLGFAGLAAVVRNARGI